MLDVPCTYNDLYFEVLANAGQVVLVCEQKVPSIRALKLVREALGRADADDSEFLVINRYDPKVQGFTVADLAKLLQVSSMASDRQRLGRRRRLRQSRRPAPPGGAPVPRLDRHRLPGSHPAGRGTTNPRRRPRASASSAGCVVPSAILEDRSMSARIIKLLHVEDDLAQHRFVTHHLASIGEYRFDIRRAESEDAALDEFNGGGVDFVILDYHLTSGQRPELPGEAPPARPDRADHRRLGVATPEIAAELLQVGADDFISKKDLSGDVLARSVRDALARADAWRRRTQGREQV